MKKLIFLFSFLLLFACQENNKKKNSQTAEKPEVEKSIDQPGLSRENLCFLSTIGSSEIQGKTVQDSLRLTLEIRKNKVSGTYDWIPAEKDSRKGKLSGTKKGNLITGEYVFMQEGMEQTQPIVIELHENFAKVTTNGRKPDKMVVNIEKVKCE